MAGAVASKSALPWNRESAPARTQSLVVSGSDPGEPVVALVFPVTTAGRRHKVDRAQILDHFVTQLDRRVEPHWGAMLGAQRMTVHCIGQDRLRMKGTGAVPR